MICYRKTNYGALSELSELFALFLGPRTNVSLGGEAPPYAPAPAFTATEGPA